MKPRTITENCFATVQLVARQPRTAAEVASLLGIKHDTAMRYLRMMEAEGLVTVDAEALLASSHGRLARRWVWFDQGLSEPDHA